MGRGRTTTGMVAASLIATIAKEELDGSVYSEYQDSEGGMVSEGEETMNQYLNGKFRRKQRTNTSA